MVNSEYLSSGAVAGLVAGGVSRVLTAPLDVIKIRFQLQQSINPVYTSTVLAFASIIRNEGILSLWKGNLNATYLWMSYGMIQFGMYDALKTKYLISS